MVDVDMEQWGEGGAADVGRCSATGGPTSAIAGLDDGTQWMHGRIERLICVALSNICFVFVNGCALTWNGQASLQCHLADWLTIKRLCYLQSVNGCVHGSVRYTYIYVST